MPIERGRSRPRRAARLPQRAGVGSGAILVDGVVWGIWRLLEDELVIRHVDRPGRRAAAVEARQLLRFLGAQPKIRFESV